MRVVLRSTVVGDIEWRFDDLSEGHRQNQMIFVASVNRTT